MSDNTLRPIIDTVPYPVHALSHLTLQPFSDAILYRSPDLSGAVTQRLDFDPFVDYKNLTWYASLDLNDSVHSQAILHNIK